MPCQRLLVQTQQGTGWFLGTYPLQWCIWVKDFILNFYFISLNFIFQLCLIDRTAGGIFGMVLRKKGFDGVMNGVGGWRGILTPNWCIGCSPHQLAHLILPDLSSASSSRKIHFTHSYNQPCFPKKYQYRTIRFKVFLKDTEGLAYKPGCTEKWSLLSSGLCSEVC